MDIAPDELAGIADLFGGLSRPELREAVENVAARRGASFDPESLAADVEAARREYYLLVVEMDDVPVIAPGPAALPRLPEHAEDLPHMMDVTGREIGRERLAEAAHERLTADADRAIGDDNRERIDVLVDVSYDVEAWGSVDVAGVRARLLDARERS